MICESLYFQAAAWIRDQMEGLRIPLDGPDALHDQRVATRRLRMACRVFFEELGDKHWPKQLRDRTRRLGEARQWDVQEALLTRLRESAVVLREQAALEFAQERARKRCKQAWRSLRAPPPKGLLRGAERFARKVGVRADLASVPSLAWRSLHPLLLEAFGPLAGLYAAEDPEGMHRARMALKRLRYATEILRPAFVQDPEAFLAEVRDLQTKLGDHHDLVVLQAYLRGEWNRLEERGRRTLSSGLALALQRLEQDRLGQYEAFRAQGGREPLGARVKSLRLALGLEPPREATEADPEVSG